MKIIEAKAGILPLWEDFNKKSRYSSFLQSFAWGDFQKTEKIDNFRLALEETRLKGGFDAKAHLVGIAQIFKHPLPLGKSYLYIPHGPIIDEKIDEEEALNLWFEKIKEIAKNEKSIFLLAEPKQNLDQIQILKKSSKHIQAETTLILDLSRTKAEILGQMKSKTRYNIGLAKRKGVRIHLSKNLDDISIFIDLAKETSKRDEFRLHPSSYYRQMFKNLSDKEMIELLLARYKKKWIAAILIVYYGDMATYLHGASDYEHRYLMAPNLLQWVAIRRAKKRGCKKYDFWGVTKSSDPDHHWAGFSRFKFSFAPNTSATEYPGPYEYIFSPISTLGYKTIQRILGRR
ncbi:peptidoglycan bridge formation glycyltransferase FemA/FemB family protein [Patescibacteria group bacterium]|nr:peptidoglycan bridge formation glycyltransferase FemA/FemB family protein [Patescibacteria group bacterium]